MKKLLGMMSPLILAMICFITLMAPGETQALMFKLSLEELAGDADSVVVGTVVERSSYWNADHTMIYTDIIVSLEENLKSHQGTAGKNRITLTIPGGEVGGMKLVVSDTAQFVPGDKSVFFLKQLSEGQISAMKLARAQVAEPRFEVHGKFQGKVDVKDGKAGNTTLPKFKEQINTAIQNRALKSGDADKSKEIVTNQATGGSPLVSHYDYSGYKWPGASPVVSYLINENAPTCTGEGATVQAAAATWNAVPSKSFTFSYVGTTAATAYSYNGFNEILWKDLGATSTVAHALVWISGTTIVENDMEFNSNTSYTWSTLTPTPGGQMDVQTVALHELGHWLMLDDLYGAGDSAKVMYGYVSTGTQKRDLHADDIAGMQAIYPSTATPPTVTNSTGESDVTSTSAKLNGQVTATGGENPTVRIYWGATDGGTTPGNWTNVVNLGTRGVGAFSTDIFGLTPASTYYYRCSATNSAGTSWAGSTETLTTLAAGTMVKLMGADGTASWAYSLSPNYICFSRFQAEQTGNMTTFAIRASGSGNVKVAIYSDSSGAPGTLLNSTASTAVSSGWNNISIASTAVTAGTYYWLALNSDSQIVCYYYPSASTAPIRFRAAPFGDSFPASAGSGFTGFDNTLVLAAGWGSTVPASAPTVANSTGESNVTWNSARLNGEVTATGGANPTVRIYWGDNDGGTTIANWDRVEDLGTRPTGTFYADVSGLTASTLYYYRCFAQNSGGSSWASATEQFTTSAAPQKLLGADEAAPWAYSLSPNYICFSRFQAEQTGSVTIFRLRASGSGNVKVAIYSDNSGEPGTLLNSTASTAVSSGWNNISIASTAVTAGTYYWLAFNSDSQIVCYYYPYASSAPFRFRVASFGDSFPASAGSGFISYSNVLAIVAGWGSAVPPTPPDAPTLSSPGAAITFKWNSSTGATKYWLQANTQSDFNGTNIINAEVGNVTTQEVSGFTLGTIYYWRVKAGNSGGWSSWSLVRSVLANTVP